MIDTIVLLVVAETALNGIAAGASLDQSIKQLPARHRIGVVAYSAYSQASDMGNFEANSPCQTLTHDICHGQIRRDFTSDEFFPGLYSHAKAHIAKRIGTIPWLLRASARENYPELSSGLLLEQAQVPEL